MMTASRKSAHNANLFHRNEVAHVRAYPMERLLDVLRHDLELTGTKEGCGEGECGSCSVLLDCVLVNSCLIQSFKRAALEIVTIEGLASDGRLQLLRNPFSTAVARSAASALPA